MISSCFSRQHCLPGPLPLIKNEVLVNVSSKKFKGQKHWLKGNPLCFFSLADFHIRASDATGQNRPLVLALAG